MSNYQDDIKQRRWNELKAVVGTASSRNMNIDELLLNVKGVSFDSLIRQSDIQTEEDKNFYVEKGYPFVITADEFREKFSVDPECIWYTPSISQSSLYFNEKTFAAAPFHLDFYIAGFFSDMESFYRIIEERELEAANNDFAGSMIALPDAMRIEYLNRLVTEKGSDLPGLYQLFVTFYAECDYGFGNLAPATVKAILNAKTEEDRAETNQKLVDYPDSVKIYRGGNSASTPYEKAYSWTTDINTANFFACRRGSGEGYIAEAEVAKKDIIEYLDGRGEDEVFVDPVNVHVLSKTTIRGMDFIEEVLPKVAPMYHDFLIKMSNLTFAQNSDVHGCEHEARVLLNTLMLSEALDLPLRDRKVLAEAAIYHDTQRVNDDVDPTHGEASKEFYLSSAKAPDPLVAFLCEYHCLPDETAYKEIRNNRQLSKNRSRAKLLFDVFKDADALDRVRFGLRDLDLNQLRVPVSKELSLVARLCLDYVTVPVKPKIRKPSLSEKIASASSRVATVSPEHHQKRKEPTYEH